MSDDDNAPQEEDASFKQYCDRFAIPYAAEHAAQTIHLKKYTDPMITPELVQSQRDLAIAADHLHIRGPNTIRTVPLLFDQARLEEQSAFMQTLQEGETNPSKKIDLINMHIDGLPAFESGKTYLWNISLSVLKQLKADGCGLAFTGTGAHIIDMRSDNSLFGGTFLLCSLTDVHLKDTELFGSFLDCDMTDSQFDHCSFNDMELKNQPDITVIKSFIRDCHFKNCTFKNVDMSHLEFDGCTFDHCTFENVDMQGVKMTGDTAFINDCDLRGVHNISSTERDDTVQIERSDNYPLGAEKSVLLKRNLVDSGEAKPPVSALSIGGDKPTRNPRIPLPPILERFTNAANDN